jgi:farnesyl diphosphate synthase
MKELLGSLGVVGGQQDDLDAECKPVDAALLERIHRRKTAALIRASCELGAIAAAASPAQHQALATYGEALGLAFQIADDLLDVEGESAKTGKAVQKDAAAGKATFVSLLGVERARNQANALIDQAIAHLSGFGPEADLLRAIARYTVERDR